MSGKKRETCPKCGASAIPVVYSFLSPEGWEAAERGEFYPAGCCFPDEGGAAWHCPSCGHESGHQEFSDTEDEEEESEPWSGDIGGRRRSNW
ncbi:MAG: hypothetical protein Kow00109_15030 [Acidobacteriota bacterium]